MMIVVMKPDARVAEIGAVLREIEALGLKPHPSRGARETVIGVIGAKQVEELERIQKLPGVAQITPISKAFKLVSRDFQPEPTVIGIDGVTVGGPEIVVMAGPCSVETPEQIALHRARGPRRRRAHPARRGLQAAHLALRLPGPGRGGPADPAGREAARPACRS